MQPGVTRASVLISRSTWPVLARIAWLLARQNPTFSVLAMTSTHGHSRARCSTEPSADALSTTITSLETPGGRWSTRLWMQSSSNPTVFQLTITVVRSGEGAVTSSPVDRGLVDERGDQQGLHVAAGGRHREHVEGVGA